MCGICGIFDFSSKSAKREEVEKMCRTLEHRGPDDEGFYISKGVKLGNRRLSIIDLGGGHQPIHNEDKTIWITFNGEIYNFIELREDLLKCGHRFYTKTDTEVIIHLYEEYGEKCFNKLDGMFAIGIWDQKKEQLFLARDPVGEKPLFWSFFENKFIFSSEIKGILAYPSFCREIDQEALGKFFLYGFIPAPNCIFKGIKKILPGHFLIVKPNGKIKETKYWEFDYSKKFVDLSREEIKKKVKTALKGAVEERLISDVPLGVLLSGGVDSSLVTAIMAKAVKSSNISAFTIGFKESPFDESSYAKMVADYLGVKHYLKIFAFREVFNLIPKIADLMDEPMADPSILPTFLISAFTSEKVKVVLSGDGGDESFGGYPKYLAHLLLKKTYLEKLPISLPAGYCLGRFGRFLKYMSYPLYLRNQLWINPFTLEEVGKLTGSEPDFSDLERYHQSFNGKDLLDEAFFLDQKLTLADLYLVKTDRASMANSLEVRCPFLDKNLIELCARIPFMVKMNGFRLKSLLKEIALDYLPVKAVLRPKMGFGIPLKEWLKDGFETDRLLSGIKEIDILGQKEATKLIKNGTPHQKWALIVFNLWYQRWLKN